MNNRRRKGEYLALYWTEEEKEEIKKLFNASNIGKQSQSEHFIDYIINGLKEHNKNLDINTQTNQHSLNDKEVKKQTLEKIKGFVKTKPKTIDIVFDYFFKTFSDDFGTERTRLTWFKRFFEKKEFVILHLDKYFVIERNSYYHKQLNECCFEFPYEDINYQPTSIKAAKQKLYAFIKKIYYPKKSLDTVEKIVIKQFAYDIEEEFFDLDNLDIMFKEVINLRSKGKYQEALNILNNKQEVLLNEI